MKAGVLDVGCAPWFVLLALFPALESRLKLSNVIFAGIADSRERIPPV